jgi:hypothetical protein
MHGNENTGEIVMVSPVFFVRLAAHVSKGYYQRDSCFQIKSREMSFLNPDLRFPVVCDIVELLLVYEFCDQI